MSKLFLTEFNSTFVIIAELIIDLKQNPKTLRFCECSQQISFFHTPCESSWFWCCEFREGRSPGYCCLGWALHSGDTIPRALAYLCEGTTTTDVLWRVWFLSQNIYISLAWAHLNLYGPLKCHDFMKCIILGFYWWSWSMNTSNAQDLTQSVSVT